LSYTKVKSLYQNQKNTPLKKLININLTKMKTSQINFVKSELKNKGYISRNHCVRKYILRLGAIINHLIAQGYVFHNFSKKPNYNVWGRKEDVGYGKNDFVYTLRNKKIK